VGISPSSLSNLLPEADRIIPLGYRVKSSGIHLYGTQVLTGIGAPSKRVGGIKMVTRSLVLLMKYHSTSLVQLISDMGQKIHNKPGPAASFER
jgi:hypothetical protein